jgi:hypothetical protein
MPLAFNVIVENVNEQVWKCQRKCPLVRKKKTGYIIFIDQKPTFSAFGTVRIP